VNARSKYDMQQAMSMRGQASSLPPQQPNASKQNYSTQRNSNSKINETQPQTKPKPSTFTTKQITDAVKQLDQAETLSKRGKLEESSCLYENSLATLIQILGEIKLGHKPSDSNNNSRNVKVLLERTRVAMTEAEVVKARIKSVEKAKTDAQQKELDERAKLKEKKSIFSSFMRKSKSERVVNRNDSNKNTMKPLDLKATKSDVSHYTQHRRPSSQDNASKLSSSSQKSSTTTKPRSNLDYKTNDPIIETIKKDMYVDSKSLTTTWKDITGLKISKQTLQEAAILPLLRPDLYTGLRTPPKGILLYGPPGTGKTMLVKAVAHESQCILFACSASAMTSKWVGEGEKIVRTLFRMAADVAPSIIFLDEMDALLGRRKSDGNSEQESSRRFKTEFMVQMDGIAAGSGSTSENDLSSLQRRILLIGCTNCPWDVDDAVMRRFQRRIYVPLPDKAARKTLWEALVEKSKGNITIDSRDVEMLVAMSSGFSCSDISSIANEAAFGPLRDLGSLDAIREVDTDDVRSIQMKDFDAAIRIAKKSVSGELLKKYDEWEQAQAAGR